jgi:malyl-CoA/(S)-citramalyl-CoA lyase
LSVEGRSACFCRQGGGALGLLGGADSRRTDGHHRCLGGARRRQRQLDPPLKLADQRRARVLRQQPVLGALARRSIHLLKVRRQPRKSSAPHSNARLAFALDFGPTENRATRSSVRNPRDFFQPQAIGAPEPLREIPVKPSRMIHFLDFSNEKMVAKAAAIAEKTDILLGNLEDAIPVDRKEAARQGLIRAAKESDFGLTALWTRVNSLESPWVLDDLTTLVTEIGDKLEVVMVPKVEGAWDIHYVDRLLAQLEAKAGLDRPILIHAILETAQGVVNLEEIAAASPRMQGMSFGPADLAASRRMKTTRVGGGHPGYRVMEDPSDPENPEADRVSAQQDLWHYSIARMVDACAATGILPFYGPFGDIKDTAGCETQFRAAFLMGCVGAWSLHPVQIGIAKNVFSPPPEEVKFAKKVLEAIPDGRGVHMIDGKMQDDATWKQCKVMVELAEMLAAKDPELAETYGL